MDGKIDLPPVTGLTMGSAEDDAHNPINYILQSITPRADPTRMHPHDAAVGNMRVFEEQANAVNHFMNQLAALTGGNQMPDWNRFLRG